MLPKVILLSRKPKLNPSCSKDGIDDVEDNSLATPDYIPKKYRYPRHSPRTNKRYTVQNYCDIQIKISYQCISNWGFAYNIC